MFKTLEASEKAIKEATEKHGRAAPGALRSLPDDLAALESDVEAYIKGFEAIPKCRWTKKLSAPGVVLVLGDPQTAVRDNKVLTDTNGYVYWTVAVLNDQLPNHPKVKKLHEAWAGSNERKNVKLPQTPSRFQAWSEELNNFLFAGGTAFTNDDRQEIWIASHIKVKGDTGGYLIHEAFHMYAGGEPADLGLAFDEGYTEYFARDFVEKYPKWKSCFSPTTAYIGTVRTVEAIVAGAGQKKVARLYFERFAKINKGAATKIGNAAESVEKHLANDNVDKQRAPKNELDAFIAAVKSAY